MVKVDVKYTKVSKIYSNINQNISLKIVCISYIVIFNCVYFCLFTSEVQGYRE